MKKNLKLVIEYDGTLYHGWQRQKSVKTVQEEIEKVLKMIMGEDIGIAGAGRTDAGVHARGQTASFFCSDFWECKALRKSLNSLLPDDIVIKECTVEKDEFHARYDARSKVYNYVVFNGKLPSAICRNYFWHIDKKLFIPDMKKALSYIIGSHDFTSFEGAGSPKLSRIRTIFNAKIEEKPDEYVIFELEADGFLRYMVRNIVGTLVDVGLGRKTPENFAEILESKKRAMAGKTAPPEGLFLMKVSY